MKKIITKSTVLALAVWLAMNLSTSLVLATNSNECNPGDGGIDLGTCLKLSDDKPIKDVYTTPAFLVNLIVRNLMIVGGMMVLVLAIIVGYKYLTGGKKAMDDIKSITAWGLVGFLVMFGAYWIVQIIKLVTGADILL